MEFIFKFKILFVFIEGLIQRGLKDSLLIAWSSLRDHDIDQKYQIETRIVEDVRSLNSNLPNASKATVYRPTRTRPLIKLFRELNIDKKQGFVDLGSGKGRVLILAAEFGFHQVTGVEFSPEIHQVAEMNIAKVSDKFPETHFKLIHSDVVNYKVDPKDSIFFLYDPFDESLVLECLRKIEASLDEKDRSVRVIYHHNLIGDTESLNSFKVTKFKKALKFEGNQFFIFSNNSF